ncbi:Metacaspase-1 [Fusarium oxysporum f. sp. albedinis]|nr:Metacaspase-1 [Fusarium oxysporum f. sp. albedinis]
MNEALSGCEALSFAAACLQSPPISSMNLIALAAALRSFSNFRRLLRPRSRPSSWSRSWWCWWQRRRTCATVCRSDPQGYLLLEMPGTFRL